MLQFALLNSDPKLRNLFEFIQQHALDHELHLNRTRVWIPEGHILTEFLLRFDSCYPVSEHEDLATGRINTQ
jgi:hypothetical protein